MAPSSPKSTDDAHRRAAPGAASASRLALHGGTPVRDEFLVFGQPVLSEEAIAEVVATLRSTWIGTGPRVQRFEQRFRDYIGCSHALSVSSCTAALHLALITTGIEAGDEVLVPALTFVASANVVVHAGAHPVFVDVDPLTLNLDLADAERKITPRTRAVIAVHFAGLPLDLAALQALAARHGLAIIEDAAHAVGAAIDGARIGSGPNLTAFSFYANKNITTGEGGMLTCSGMSESLHARLAAMRLHGLTNDAWRRYHTKATVRSELIEAGFKYNMTDLQAALGLHQIEQLDGFLARREAVAARYRDALGVMDGLRLQITPRNYGRLRHGLHLFVLVLDPAAWRTDRDTIVEALRAENIGAAVHYGAVPSQRYYRERMPGAAETTPVACAVGESILSLPIGAAFSARDEDDVIEATRKVLAHYAR